MPGAKWGGEQRMFLGEFQHTLDAKGRLSLPRKFRDRMPGRELVVSKGMEGCLYVTPAGAYEDTLQRLLDSNEFDREARRLQRFFLSGATEVELDSAGRVNVSAPLRAHAGLDKDVTVIGAGTRMEVWDTATWEAYNAETASGLEDSAADLADKGIL